jgi:hypothetical protein
MVPVFNSSPRPPKRVLLTEPGLAAATVTSCVAFALLARVLNPVIGYANGVNCDSWYFLGIYLNFDALYHSGRFYQTFRFAALVPWTWLGEQTDYETLNLLRFTTYHALTCAAFVWFGLRLFGPRVGVLITVLFCCSTSLLGVLSHDYLTAAGLTWISLLIGSTVEAGRSRHLFLWSLVSGCLVGMCAFTHLPTALFIFAVPLLLLASSGPEPRRGLLSRFAVFLLGCGVGFVAVATAFGLYNVWLGGDFYYLGGQIEVALSVLGSAGANATIGRTADFRWLANESIVPLLVVAMVGSVMLLLLERGRLISNPVATAALVCLTTSALVFGWQLSGRILLDNNVYGAWAYPFVFVGFGGMLARLSSLRTISTARFSGLLLLLFAAFLWAAVTKRDADADYAVLAAQLVAGLAFLSMFATLRNRSREALAIVPLTALVVLSYPTTYGSDPWYEEERLAKDMTIQAANAIRLYRSLNLDDLPTFWVGASVPEVISVPRSFLNCAAFAGSFPSASTGEGGTERRLLPLTRELIGDSRTLAVVAEGSGLGTTAAATLDQLGFESAVLAEAPIGSGQLHTWMAVLTLVSR